MNNKADYKQERGRPLPRGQPGRRLANGGFRAPLATDLLILCDGTVLAHNLTPGMAEVLHQINPEDQTMRRRVLTARKPAASSDADRWVGLCAT